MLFADRFISNSKEWGNNLVGQDYDHSKSNTYELTECCDKIIYIA